MKQERKEMNNFPIPETEQLVLREFQDPGAQAAFDIFSQDSTTWYLDSVTMQSVEEAERKVKSH